MLNCRKCKRALTTFLSSYITDNVKPLLQEGQRFVTSGATDTAGGVEVRNSIGKCQAPAFNCTADESDTRIWLHVKYSAGEKKFIVSPDTDVYHIGLPLLSSTASQVMVQLSRPSDKDLKLLVLNLLLNLLKHDPDLAHISNPDIIPHIMQVLYTATGCDYISFFHGIGKSYFFKVFFENAKFIIGSHEGVFATLYTQSDLHNQA